VAKVLFIKPIPAHKRVQIGIENDDGETVVLKVRESTYTSLGAPERGKEISDSTFDSLKREDELLRAYRKAVGWLADSDRSRFELKRKLYAQGFTSQIIDVVLDKCEEYGYLDENRQLERLVEREANRKLRGRYYIRRKLISKGYRASAIDRVTDQLVENGEIDFNANFERLVQKRGDGDEDKIMTLKYRYGYEN
jgi:SOS response regulatory protein OraA/RecX